MQSVRRILMFTLAFIFPAVPQIVRAQSPLQFVAVTPCRLVDTRPEYGGNGPIQGGTFQNFTIPQLGGCNIPTAAAAYSLNVTVVPHGFLGYLTVWPAGQSQPLVSTLNSYDGRVKANAAIVEAGANDAISVFAYNTTDVVLDIDGYFAPPSNSTLAFYPVTPCRVADTRNGQFLPGGQEADFPVSGMCNIPNSATAYSLNLTVQPHGPLGYLSVWPAGQQKPLVSTLNSPTGTLVANAAMVGAGTDGKVAVYPLNDTDLIIDIDGYYALTSSAPGGLSLYTLTPCRILDTRMANGAFSGTLPVNAVGSACGLPSLAQALVLNATVEPEGFLGYLSLWPNGQNQPLVSTLNAYDGAVTSNMAVTPTTNGFVNAYALDPTQLIVDVSSYFAIPAGLSGNYTLSFNGFDSVGPVLMAGSFVADGGGNISGILDLNSASGTPRTSISFKGTYSIQPNGLGTLSITPPPFNKSMTFSVAVSNTGNTTLILDKDSNGFLPNTWGSGVIKVQNPAAFSYQQIAGSFASGFLGVDSGANRFVGAGVYQITKTQNVTGTLDTNDNGNLQNLVPTSGILQTLDSNTGRGTAMFVTGGITSHWVYYVTTANDLTFLAVDPIGSPANLLLQSMLRQGSVSFDNSSLNGVSVFETSGIAQSCGGCGSPVGGNKRKQNVPDSIAPDIVLGLLTADGNGSGSIRYDENDGGTLTQNTSPLAYSVASNGRVALTFGSNTPVLYLVNQNQGFLIGQDIVVAAGWLDPQSGSPFSTASAIGTYWGGSVAPVISSVTDSVTWAFADGNGNMNGIANTSGSGGTGSQNFSGVLSVDATGRITLSENGNLAAILYVVSPTKVALLPATDPNPALSVLGSTN